ncbi:TonB-dependent siderophore receptor [uncultured Sphingomonas sp.]|uniref:TonB-dependent receptor n=1 Tax=uncultured Sphingomonas sp. TaxID=158754 RepID=UPI00261370F4|nr:TonB-dependent receptor [uncultured Sphingomonas sp.]
MTAAVAARSSGAFLALSCIGAFATAPAGADEVKPTAAAPDQDRPEIVVNGHRQRPDADPKQVAPLVDTPRSVMVLTSDVIQQTGSTTLQEALRTIPGITFGAAEGGNPLGDRPFIRGFDTQGSIYLDGVRDIGAQSREVFAVDRVQLVRGSDSTLGGRGGAGGTINIVSKLPQSGTFGQVSGSYGNADFKRITGDVNVQLADGIAFRVQGLWHDQDVAGRDAIYNRRWGFAPSFAIGLGTPTRLTASYYRLETHELPDSGLPYRYNLVNAPGTGTILNEPVLGRFTTIGGQTGVVDRSTFYGLVDRDFRDTSTDQAMVRVEHDFAETLTLRNTARYAHTTQAYIFTQPDDSQGNVFGTSAAPVTGTAAQRGDRVNGGFLWRRANTRHGVVDSIVNQTDLYGKVSTGGIAHSFAVGAEFAWEKARRGTYVLATGSTASPRCNTATLARFHCTDVFAPNPRDPWRNYVSDTSTVQTPIVRGAPATETQQDATTQGVYAFDSVTLLPELMLNLGVRFDRFRSKVTPPGTIQAPVRRTDELFNWQAGLIYKPTPETSLYASYATSATPPNSLTGEGREDNALPTSLATQQNRDILDSLQPQKTKSYEVGAKASLVGDRLQLGLAAFQTDISNARVTSEQNTIAFIGRSRVRGIELSVSGTILPGWTVFGGYSYLDPRILDGGFSVLTAPAVGARPAQSVVVPSVNTGRQLPQTVKNSFSASTNVELFQRLSIGGTAIYMDRQYGGYQDNRSAVQNAAGTVTVNPASKLLVRTIPGYWRFDARAALRLTDMIELAVNAQNLTDKAYFSQAFTSHYGMIAPGRTVFGTVNVRF